MCFKSVINKIKRISPTKIRDKTAAKPAGEKFKKEKRKISPEQSSTAKYDQLILAWQ